MQQTFSQQLNFFAADLLTPGSFTQAMKNCDVVVHTASPYFLEKPQNLQLDLIDPAIKGTQNVLHSVNNTSTVKKVILTSSIVALFNNASDYQNIEDHKVLASHVNDNQDLEYNAYAYSKTQAEKAAWKMADAQTKWQLITVHPGAIFGPSLSARQDATSVKMLIQFLNGSFKSGVPNLYLGVVDVRDVAKLHVQAALNNSAEGKYIAVAKTLSLLQISCLLNVGKFNLTNKLPSKELPKWLIWLIAPLIGMQRKFVKQNIGYAIEFDTVRSQMLLGGKFIESAKTFNDHLEQVVASKLM